MPSSSTTSVTIKTSAPTLVVSGDPTLIDGVFRVERMRWGTYRSIGADGKEIITALHEQLCIDATRFYLKGKQEGWDSLSSSTYEGTVGGKL